MSDDPKAGLGTAEYFSRLAATYGAGGYYRKRREAVLAEIRARTGTIDSMLDLGCGNGTYLAAFRDTIRPRILAGADLSFAMLREAGSRQAARLLVACDAAALPFRSAVWQSIFCSHVLQFIDDLQRCFAEINRCIAHGGILIVAGGELGTRERLKMMMNDERLAVFQRELPRPRDAAPRRSFIEYQQAARTAGFEVESRNVEFRASWADLAEFYRVRWLPLVEPEVRASLAGILEEVLVARGAEQLTLSETLLFCRKP